MTLQGDEAGLGRQQSFQRGIAALALDMPALRFLGTFNLATRQVDMKVQSWDEKMQTGDLGVVCMWVTLGAMHVVEMA